MKGFAHVTIFFASGDPNLAEPHVAACPVLGIYLTHTGRRRLPVPCGNTFLRFQHFFCSSWPAQCLAAGDLRAGAAKAVITPDVHATRVYMAGYGQNRVATGVHDDLYARCLALGAGDQTLVVCAADLIGLFYDDVLKIRERVKAQAPEVTHLIVASTHDHEGPDTLGTVGSGAFAIGDR